MQPTFLFIDLENMQPEGLSALSGGTFKIKVFLGANQTKMTMELVRALQPFGPNVEYIQATGIGPNALDFHIAFYLGLATVENPKSRFVIVSKDTGFDPLVAHLRARDLKCERSVSIAGLVSVAPSGPQSNLDRIHTVIADLVKRRTSVPRTLKTLRSTIHALFKKELSDDELSEILVGLTNRGITEVLDGKVRYHLPNEPLNNASL